MKVLSIESPNYSKEFYYLMGAYLGDGSIDKIRTKDGFKFGYFRIILKDGMFEPFESALKWYQDNLSGIVLSDRFQCIFDSSYNDEDRLLRLKAEVRVGKAETYYHCNIQGKGSCLFSQYLDSVCGRTKDKRFPDSIWTASEECKWYFLAGLFDTDGSIVKQGFLFNNTNKDMVYNVQKLLLDLNIDSNIIIKKSRLYGKDYGLYYRLTVLKKKEISKLVTYLPLQNYARINKVKELFNQYVIL